MKNMPADAEFIIKTLEDNGFEAYLVGGCVRDMLLGMEPKDFDITTNALPEKIKSLFEKTVDTGIKHGTVTVITDGTPFEVTTFRSDGDYLDMRRPETVNFVSDLKDDLARRDFTVNAMAYNSRKGVVDCFGGMADLEAKTLRAVGDPEKRFNEDALRIMRLVRFASVLDFVPEKKTFKAAKKLCKNLRFVSAERVFAELSKLLAGKNPDTVSDIIACGGLESFGISGKKSLKKLACLTPKTELRLFGFIKILSVQTEEFAKNLKIKNSIKNYLKKCEAIMFLTPEGNDFEIKTALAVAGREILLDVCEFKTKIGKTDMSGIVKRAEKIIKSAEPYTLTHLKISGKEIEDLGFSGEKIGEILKALCDNVRRHPENNKRDTLLKIASEEFKE